MIEAITFDLWDTVIQDDSDELDRQERGLRSKYDERRHIVGNLFNAEAAVPFEMAVCAYDAVDAAFNKTWHDQYATWTVADRLELIAKSLAVKVPAEALDSAIWQLETMEVEVPPKPVEGIEEILRQLAGTYSLAVISDAIVTPGRELRRWLEKFNLLQYFSGFAFSDEVGRSKPHPRIFQSAADQLGVELSRIAHIGDREHNDIKGARAMNMRAILFVGSRATDLDGNTADAVCDDYKDMPAILNSLSSP